MEDNTKNIGIFSETLFFIVLIHFHGVIASCQNVDSQGIFTIHPMDQFSKEGSNITLTCSASLSTFREISLEWHVVPDIYTKRVTVNKFLLHVNSTINIYRVGRMRQMFTCILYTDNGKHKSCYKSHTARTNIVYFPRRDEVSCGPQTFHSPFNEGDMVNIYCGAPRSRPPIDLIWLTENSTFNENAGVSHLKDGLRRVLTTQIRISRRFHFVSLKCKITSQRYFPGQTRECKIGMLLVNHKPIVNISLLALTTYKSNFHLHFQCTADAFPDRMIFTWSCSPRNHLRSCESSKNILNMSLPVERNRSVDSVVTIICNASNDIGSSSDYFEIRLIKNDSDSLCNDSKEGTFRENTGDSNFLLDRYDISALKVSWFSDGIQFEIISTNPGKSTPSMTAQNSVMPDINFVASQEFHSFKVRNTTALSTCVCFNESNVAMFHTSDQRDNGGKPLTEIIETPNNISLHYGVSFEETTFNSFTSEYAKSDADKFFDISHEFIPNKDGDHGNHSIVNSLIERNELTPNAPDQSASNSNIWRNVSFACLAAIITVSICGFVAIAAKRHIKRGRRNVNTGLSNVGDDKVVVPLDDPIYEVPKELKMTFELQHDSVVFDDTSMTSQTESNNSSSDSSQYQSDTFSYISAN